MIVIPEEKLAEWQACYLRLIKEQPVPQSFVSYVAHCAAQWAYMQGMIDMQRFSDDSYH